MQTLHPTTKIIALSVLAIDVQFMTPIALVVMTIVLMLMLVYYRPNGYLRMLKRMRWLFLTLLIVYAFNTPGEYLEYLPSGISLTYEGLHAGWVQIGRIAIMLAGLSVLTATTGREALIVGFYLIMRPLGFIGLNAERFAARLWLTLHYVEEPKQHPMKLLEKLRSFDTDEFTESNAVATIEMVNPQFHGVDYLVLLAIIMSGVILL